MGIVGWTLFGGLVGALNPFAVRDRILIGQPNRAGEMDLYVLGLGDEVRDSDRIYENAVESPQVSLAAGTGLTYDRLGLYPSQLGGFLPGSSALLLGTVEDGDVVVRRWAAGAREPDLLLNANSMSVSAAVLTDRVFFWETVDQRTRCYLARAGAKAERLGKGTGCQLVADGDRLAILDQDTKGSTVTLVRATDGQELSNLKIDEADLLSLIVSPDGTQVVFVKGDASGATLYAVDAVTGERALKSARLASLRGPYFATEGHRFVFFGMDDGEDGVYLSDAPEAPVAVGASIAAARLSPDGQALAVVVVDEDGERAASVVTANGREPVELVRGEQIGLDILDQPARFLIATREDSEAVLYAAGLDGQGLTELYREDDLSLGTAVPVAGDRRLLLTTATADNRASLIGLDWQGSDPIVWVDEWAVVTPLTLSMDRRYLIFTGQEELGDDPSLYALDLAGSDEPVELDDDGDRFVSVAFDRATRSVLYTVVAGNRADDVEIRRVPLDGSDSPETLYEGAILLDVQWPGAPNRTVAYLGTR